MNMDNYSDRMATPKKRGRPSNEEILARGEPTPVEHVGEVAGDRRLPAVQPMRCVCCGRGMTPKVVRTGVDRRTLTCSLCGGTMTIVYRPDQPPVVARI